MTPEREIELLRAIAGRAEATLLEQRREFARGEIGDLDQLEDALDEWKREAGKLFYFTLPSPPSQRE